MASVFPDTSVNNPDTGFAWADGDIWNDPDSGLTYSWYNPVWKTGGAGNDNNFVLVAGDNMTGDLTLGTDKITLDATDGSAQFVGGGVEINTPGSIVVNNASGSKIAFDGEGYYQTKTDGFNNAVTLLNDGSATFAGGASVAGGSEIRVGNGQAAFVVNDGSGTANLAGSTIVLQDTSGNNTVDIKSLDGSASFSGAVSATATTCNHPSAVIKQTISYWRDLAGGDITFLSGGEAEFSGAVTSSTSFAIQLEADDDTKYTSTTDSEGNETRVYNGTVLDVKDRIQNVLARMDAIEANEITDDATDSALLTLIASLSARLDERDAVIAALTARVSTLES